MYQFRPITLWPGKQTNSPRSSDFSAGWEKTLTLLERELKHLGAKSIVLQAYVNEQQIRRDGMLYSNAQPSRPGVILSFQSKHGPLSYPCDTFKHWQDNVRAIARALEALRSVDRYGVTSRAEQYRGWQSLPAPTDEPPTLDEARATIREVIGIDVFNRMNIDEAIREAVMRSHPDKGGSATDFKRVMIAKQVIEAN